MKEFKTSDGSISIDEFGCCRYEGKEAHEVMSFFYKHGIHSREYRLKHLIKTYNNELSRTKQSGARNVLGRTSQAKK